MKTPTIQPRSLTKWWTTRSATGTASRQRHRSPYYRHTTPEMAARVLTALEERLVVVLVTAEAALDRQP